MCGILGFLDRLARRSFPTGRVVLTMLEALGRRGPDGSGIVLLRESRALEVWHIRISSDIRPIDLACVEPLGKTAEASLASPGSPSPDRVSRSSIRS